MTDENTETLTRAQVLGMIKDHIERGNKPILEALEGMKASLPQPDKKASKTDLVEDPRMAEVLKQNALFQKRFDEQEARDKANNLELSLNRELTAYGVTHTEHAKAYLKGAGLVKYDTLGNLVLTAADGADLPFATGIKEWVKTEAAKLYLPPKGASGTGTQPNKTNSLASRPNTSNMTEAEAEAYNNSILDEAIRKQFGR